MERPKYRVWRASSKSMEHYLVGQVCELADDDVVMIGSTFMDNKGIEVFDGDVVTGNSAGRLDSVVFANGCFCLSSAMMYYESTYWGDEIEVKGNIYQNPELTTT